MVLGYNPNFLSLIQNKLPVLRRVTLTKLIQSHLNELYSARKGFLDHEPDEKLRRALKHKTRLSTSISNQNGDQIFYKRNLKGYRKHPRVLLDK